MSNRQAKMLNKITGFNKLVFGTGRGFMFRGRDNILTSRMYNIE